MIPAVKVILALAGFLFFLFIVGIAKGLIMNDKLEWFYFEEKMTRREKIYLFTTFLATIFLVFLAFVISRVFGRL